MIASARVRVYIHLHHHCFILYLRDHIRPLRCCMSFELNKTVSVQWLRLEFLFIFFSTVLYITVFFNADLVIVLPSSSILHHVSLNLLLYFLLLRISLFLVIIELMFVKVHDKCMESR